MSGHNRSRYPGTKAVCFCSGAAKHHSTTARYRAVSRSGRTRRREVRRGLKNVRFHSQLAALSVCVVVAVFLLTYSPHTEDMAQEEGPSRDVRLLVHEKVLRHRSSCITLHEASRIARLIYDTSQKHGVDPLLMVAVGAVESNFRNDAVSEAGAVGIFQLMPVVRKKYDVDATETEENIEGGVLFMRDLLDRYDGVQRLALAHYNGGSRPDKALRSYQETIEYVEEAKRLYYNLKGALD